MRFLIGCVDSAMKFVMLVCRVPTWVTPTVVGLVLKLKKIVLSVCSLVSVCVLVLVCNDVYRVLLKLC